MVIEENNILYIVVYSNIFDVSQYFDNVLWVSGLQVFVQCKNSEFKVQMNAKYNWFNVAVRISYFSQCNNLCVG